MNLIQLKKLKLQDPQDLKIFINDYLTKASFISNSGPSLFADTWLDALFSSDEEWTFKVWILTLSKFKVFFHNNKNNRSINNASWLKAFMHELKFLIKESGVETIEFMKNTRKWHALLFNQLDDRVKASLYAIQSLLYDFLKDSMVFISSFETFLKNESKKVQIHTKAYGVFIQNILL